MEWVSSVSADSAHLVTYLRTVNALLPVDWSGRRSVWLADFLRTYIRLVSIYDRLIAEYCTESV